ncbi:uncharacterized protein BO97DRAFT_410050 [Aspergillus homomorphus CBS 101889]|uniref:DUF862-domain-containing protein n=1 Tax=Aspergillus homomorphus (strain CBS 101889) TaxID=1450537 RepID=A0A395ICC0_ASPHC|nr:hypothetical protein BO97DRAFT_410050 [Aspergillus homomorphus CBS 101889]RAL17645.1 hypothetical protein BO97DRAFT_410050 [Aspergillus homomorphus CBS 101889]
MLDKLMFLAGALLTPAVTAAALPAVTAPAAFALPTYSAVSVSASAVAGAALNTHTAVQGANGQPTSVPIVGGSDCYFCPDGKEEQGWALFGLESAGIYEDILAPEGFVTSLPVITVSVAGDPSYDDDEPTRTTEDDASLARRSVPTTTAYVDSNKFKILNKYAKQSHWTNGQGWALLAAWPASGVVPVSEHYQLIAGYVSVATKSRQEKDKKGKVTKVVETVTRDYAGYVYDIRAQQVGNVQKIVFIERGDSRETWDNGVKGLSFSSKGAIRAGLTHEIIAARGKTLADTMGNYNYLTNNCNTFANRLYNDLK